MYFPFLFVKGNNQTLTYQTTIATLYKSCEENVAVSLFRINTKLNYVRAVISKTNNINLMVCFTYK